MRRNPFPALVCLALCAGVAWLYFAPYRTVDRLQAAAESGDARALERMVDFPALRASASEELRQATARRVRGENRGRVASLGGTVAGAAVGVIADPLVSSVVTPSGIALLLEGRRPGEQRAREEEGGWRRDVKISRRYEGAHRFVVRYSDRESGTERLALVLRREGLEWRLVGVRLGGEG